MSEPLLRMQEPEAQHVRARRLVVACVFATAWIAGMSFSALATAQEPATSQELVPEELWKRGYHGFTSLCRALNLQPLEDASAWRREPPRQSLLVMFGAFDRLPVAHLDDYLRRGGALLLASDRGERGVVRLSGIDLIRGPLHVANADASFHNFLDCPQISRFEEGHPVTDGLLNVAANRPGAITIVPSARSQWHALAHLPRMRELGVSGLPFVVARETPAGGRAVVVADQTVFANQMLFHEDNAQLALNALRWLSQGERTRVLIVDDQTVIAPPAPEQVEIEVPPPTPEQVREALRNLPPEVLIAFANTVIAGLEDEGIPNEFIAFLMEKISDRNYRRLLLLVPTALLGFLVVLRLFSDAAADGVAAERGEAAARLAPRERAWAERQHAAAVLLERFRADIAAASAVPWPVFASRLTIARRPIETRLLRRALVKGSQRLAPRERRYWTRWRLRRLDQRLRAARRLAASDALAYLSPESTGLRTS